MYEKRPHLRLGPSVPFCFKNLILRLFSSQINCHFPKYIMQKYIGRLFLPTLPAEVTFICELY
jgi:hypothetical protein